MDIKEKIKRGVDEINDPQLLEELLKAVELEHEMEYINELTELEKRSIDEGISNAESGKLHSNAEASQLVKEWLKGTSKNSCLSNAKGIPLGRIPFGKF